jgi:hypothetical protein
MSDFLGRIATRAVGATPVLRPRMPHVFATSARDVAPAITELDSEVEVRPAASTLDGGGEPKRPARPSAQGDRGAARASDPDDLPLDLARIVARGEGRRRGSASEDAEDDPPVQPRAASERPSARPGGGARRSSEAKTRGALGRSPSRQSAIAHGEGRSADAPAVNQPISASVSPFASASRGGPGQTAAVEESVDVRLSIGRLEVHAPPPPAPAAPPRPRPSRRISLQDYLGRYRGGRRGE